MPPPEVDDVATEDLLNVYGQLMWVLATSGKVLLNQVEVRVFVTAFDPREGGSSEGFAPIKARTVKDQVAQRRVGAAGALSCCHGSAHRSNPAGGATTGALRDEIRTPLNGRPLLSRPHCTPQLGAQALTPPGLGAQALTPPGFGHISLAPPDTSAPTPSPP